VLPMTMMAWSGPAAATGLEFEVLMVTVAGELAAPFVFVTINCAT
jgi:hypothetical protein